MNLLEGLVELAAATVLVADGAQRLTAVPAVPSIPALAGVAYRAWQITMGFGVFEVAGAVFIVGLVLVRGLAHRPGVDGCVIAGRVTH